VPTDSTNADAFNFSTTLRHTTPPTEVVQMDTTSVAVLLSALLGWPLVASRCVPLPCSGRRCTLITSERERDRVSVRECACERECM
jgi:hypothetical protein